MTKTSKRADPGRSGTTVRVRLPEGGGGSVMQKANVENGLFGRGAVQNVHIMALS